MEAMYEEAQDNIYDLRLENDLLHQEIDELKNSHPGGRRKKTTQEKQELIEFTNPPNSCCIVSLSSFLYL